MSIKTPCPKCLKKSLLYKKIKKNWWWICKNCGWIEGPYNHFIEAITDIKEKK